MPDVHERYEIVSLLAPGGMAEVWLAIASGAAGFRKQVAIKTMLPALADNPELVEHFVREASLAADLSHPNIVQVFDFGETGSGYFMAMEYLPGLSLRDLHNELRDQGRTVPLWLLLRVMPQICDALHYVHQRGVLHHDVSPENVMITFSGGVKLIDFGAAETIPASAPPTSFVAKYRYIAPERIQGRSGDRRSDVYSLGVVLYELATGSRPFDGEDREVLAAVLNGHPADPRLRNREVPAELAAIIMKAISREPSARHRSARELGDDLQRVPGIGKSLRTEDLGAYMRCSFDRARATPRCLPRVMFQDAAV